jgi:hypothetical protein
MRLELVVLVEVVEMAKKLNIIMALSELYTVGQKAFTKKTFGQRHLDKNLFDKNILGNNHFDKRLLSKSLNAFVQ